MLLSPHIFQLHGRILISLLILSKPDNLNDFRPNMWTFQIYWKNSCRAMLWISCPSHILDLEQITYANQHCYLLDDIIQTLDDDQFAILILSDYSKALDNIDHVVFVKNFLIVPIPICRISILRSLKSGVPQRSVLGSLLFILYTFCYLNLFKHVHPICMLMKHKFFINFLRVAMKKLTRILMKILEKNIS